MSERVEKLLRQIEKLTDDERKLLTRKLRPPQAPRGQNWRHVEAVKLFLHLEEQAERELGRKHGAQALALERFLKHAAARNWDWTETYRGRITKEKLEHLRQRLKGWTRTYLKNRK